MDKVIFSGRTIVAIEEVLFITTFEDKGCTLGAMGGGLMEHG